MALTADQKRILNELGDSTPGMRKHDLNPRLLLGDELDGRLARIVTIATADAVAAASADASDLPTAITLVNELKTNFNAAVTLLNEIKASINTAITGS